MNGFDELTAMEDSKTNRNPRPFWTVDADGEESILKWLMGEFNYLSEDARDRIDQVQRNFANYRGFQYENQNIRPGDTRGPIEENKSKVSKVVVNNLYDLTESHVSRAVKYRPGISVSPANSEEFSDSVSAKMTKALLDHIWYEKNFREGIFPHIIRGSKVAGENYLWITWNPDIGELHPAYKDKSASGKQVTIVTSEGKEVVINKPIRIGDVDYEMVCADQVLLHKKNNFDDVEYCFRLKFMNQDDIKRIYPDKANEIRGDLTTQQYDYDKMEVKKVQHEALLVEFYHKPTEQLPKGKKIVFIKDKILEIEDYPYNHKRLPFVRMTDIDMPNQRHGYSFFHNIRQLTNAYNNVRSMIMRNIMLCSHPKWVMPAGAAKLESLGNDITIVQYKGPVAPQLVTMGTTSPEVFKFGEVLKEEFQTLSGVHGVSRGEPPPGVKAGVAMQFLNEQENERANNFMLKVNEFLRLVADMTISVAGQYYKKHDNRMIKIQGNSNNWLTKYFDTDWLNTSFDIRVSNSSALPEGKAQRTQNIIELNQGFPGLFTNEQVLEMLELSNDEKLLDSATLAVRSAEAENSDIMNGEKILPPAEYESHITHWRIHSRIFQSGGFKKQPKEIQEIAKDHMIATEMMMFDHAKKNPVFAENLKSLEMFPIFYFDETMMKVDSNPAESVPPIAEAPHSFIESKSLPELTNPAPSGQALVNQNIRPMQ